MERRHSAAALRRATEARYSGSTSTEEQRRWLELIRDHIAASLRIEPADFDEVPFSQRGGLGRVYQVFGEELNRVLDELNEVLVA